MFKKLLLSIALAAVSTASFATALLDGKFSMNDFNASSIVLDQTANTVTFNPAAPSLNFTVKNADGDFAANENSTGSINNFSYVDTTTQVAYSQANLFSFDQYIFSLDSITYVAEATINGIDTLNLFGYGTIVDTSGTHADATFSWNFNTSNQTWSATVVPAPAALALLGLGLVGMTLVRREKKAA